MSYDKVVLYGAYSGGAQIISTRGAGNIIWRDNYLNVDSQTALDALADQILVEQGANTVKIQLMRADSTDGIYQVGETFSIGAISIKFSDSDRIIPASTTYILNKIDYIIIDGKYNTLDIELIDGLLFTTPKDNIIGTIKDDTINNATGIAQVGGGESVGEANTGSNIGTDGVGVYDSKSGVTLQFRNIAPASSAITVTENGDDIDLDLSHLGIEDLADAGADKILFWDDSETKTDWLAANTGLSITGTNLNCDITYALAHAYIEANEVTFEAFPITPSAAPDADYEVANKKYVDDRVASADTMTELADTTITGPAENDILQWDGYSAWVDRTLAEAGIATNATAHAYVEANALTLTAVITFDAAQTFDGEDVSALASDLANQCTTAEAHAYIEANALTMTQNITFNAGQTFDGKDVSTLCTEAEAHAYVEANALTLTADVTFNAGQLFDTKDVSTLCTTAEAVQAVEDTGLVLSSAKVITSADEDIAFTFGRFGITNTGDVTYFGHRDRSGSVNDYGFYQNAAGTLTKINCVTAGEIQFCANGTELMAIRPAGLQLWNANAQISEFSTDGTMGGNSDIAVPTEKAVKTYADTKDSKEDAHAYVEATALTMTEVITFDAAQTFDGVDISALSITNMPTAVNNWKSYATNGAGVMTEIAVGAAGTFLTGNGVAAAPSFQAQPAPKAHVHDGDTLQCDGITSNGAATTITATNNFTIIAGGTLTLVSSGGVTDYIQLSTAGDVPKISTVGACDLKISSGADIDFDDKAVKNLKSLAFNDGGSTIDIIRDEDDMATDDANALATQQSIKKYVDDNATGDTKEVSHAYVEANALTLTADVTFNAGQTFDGKDVSTLCTTAEAHAYVEANALTLTADMVSRDITPSPSFGFKYYGVSLDDAYSGMIMSIDTTGCNPGDCVYIDAQNSVAIADATDNTKMPVIGIVVEAGFVLTHGSYRNTGDYAWAAGAGPIYMTTGAGVPDDTPPSGSGNIVQVIGIASGEDCIFVNPSLDWVEIV